MILKPALVFLRCVICGSFCILLHDLFLKARGFGHDLSLVIIQSSQRQPRGEFPPFGPTPFADLWAAALPATTME